MPHFIASMPIPAPHVRQIRAGASSSATKSSICSDSPESTDASNSTPQNGHDFAAVPTNDPHSGHRKSSPDASLSDPSERCPRSVSRSAEDCFLEGIRPAPICVSLACKQVRRIHPTEAAVVDEAHEPEFGEFRGDLAHGLAREPDPRCNLLKRNAGYVEDRGEDRRATRRRERCEHRHVCKIDEPCRKETHALRLEVPVLRQVPRVPAHRRRRHLQLSTNLADPGAGSKAQVSEHLTPSRVREAAALSVHVDLGAFAGHCPLQGAPEPAGHLTPPDTPG